MKKHEENKESNELVKHTAAIHINNSNTTLIARKLFNILLKNAFINLRKNITHTILLSELSKAIGWSSNSNPNEELKEAIRSMVREQIEFNILTKDKKNRWGIVTVLSGADIIGGILHYRYDTVLSEMLANPTIYARINMVIQGKFRSKYSLALWEYLTEYLCIEKRHKIATQWVTVDKIRKILGAEEEYYNDFRKLNQKVLSGALKEVNKLGDINVKISYRREKRKITYLSFLVHKKVESLQYEEEQNKLLSLECEEQKTAEVLDYIKQIKEEFNISENYLESICQGLEEKVIKNAFEAVKEYMNNGSVKNYKAIVKQAIKEKWEPQGKILSNKLPKNIINLNKLESNIKHQGWQKVWNKLKQKIDEPSFISWISKLEFGSLENNIVELIVRNNRFVKTRIENEYASQILRVWQEYDESVKEIKIKLVKEKQYTEA